MQKPTLVGGEGSSGENNIPSGVTQSALTLADKQKPNVSCDFDVKEEKSRKRV